MTISEDSKKIIVKEFEYIIQQMKGTKDPFEKLYFYSGMSATLSRIFNINYDPLLQYIHFILQVSHSTIEGKVREISGGIEKVIKIPDGFFTTFQNALEELKNCIKTNQDVNTSLVKIVNLTYVVTGNGFYLFKKGVLKI